MRLPPALLAGLLLLLAPLTGCIVPENMSELREELGYASVEIPDVVAKARASTLEPRVNETVSFTATVDGITQEAAEIAWNLDGAEATGSTVDHVWLTPGVATVELTVTGPDGQVATDAIELTVHDNAPPTPVITVETGEPLLAGEPITLTATDSMDPDGDVLGHTWTIDGTQAGTGPRIEASLTPGLHEVTLTTSDGLNEVTAFRSLAVAQPFSETGSLEMASTERSIGFTVHQGASLLEVTLDHSTRLGFDDVDLVLLDSQGEEVTASRTEPEIGSSQAGEAISLDGSSLPPGAYTLEAQLVRGTAAQVTIEGVLTYSPLPTTT